MSKKYNPAQLGLALPGSSQLARPQRVIGAKYKTGYHWGPGKPLPALGQHSIAKHDIYDNYVDRYISTLTKNHVQSQLKVTIVDGFCGGGLYDLDGATISGSPLRLIEAIEAARMTLTARREDLNLDVDFVFIAFGDRRHGANVVLLG